MKLASGMLLLILMGCTSNEHPELRQVSGTITYKGETVEDATVAFYNDDSSRLAAGRTDANGKFYLTSFTENDGALPGEHVVVVSKTEANEVEPPKLSMDEAARTRPSKRTVADNLLPKKYTSVDSSPLKVTVEDKKQNVFTFDLED